MPCNGVAVASGRIDMKLAELIFSIPSEDLTQVLVATLVRHDPGLAGAEPQKLPWRYDRGVTDFGFKLGDYLVGIQKDGRVNVSLGRKRLTAGDQLRTRLLQETLSSLLTGLAGLALQGRMVIEVRAAGAQIVNSTVAPNGAIVLEVEL